MDCDSMSLAATDKGVKQPLTNPPFLWITLGGTFRQREFFLSFGTFRYIA